MNPVDKYIDTYRKYIQDGHINMGERYDLSTQYRQLSLIDQQTASNRVTSIENESKVKVNDCSDLFKAYMQDGAIDLGERYSLYANDNKLTKGQQESVDFRENKIKTELAGPEQFYSDNRDTFITIFKNWDQWNGDDAIVSKTDLEKIRDTSSNKEELNSARFLLDHPELFDGLDRAQNGSLDEKISTQDWETWLEKNEIFGDEWIEKNHEGLKAVADSWDYWKENDHKNPKGGAQFVFDEDLKKYTVNPPDGLPEELNDTSKIGAQFLQGNPDFQFYMDIKGLQDSPDGKIEKSVPATLYEQTGIDKDIDRATKANDKLEEAQARLDTEMDRVGPSLTEEQRIAYVEDYWNKTENKEVLQAAQKANSDLHENFTEHLGTLKALADMDPAFANDTVEALNQLAREPEHAEFVVAMTEELMMEGGVWESKDVAEELGMTRVAAGQTLANTKLAEGDSDGALAVLESTADFLQNMQSVCIDAPEFIDEQLPVLIDFIKTVKEDGLDGIEEFFESQSAVEGLEEASEGGGGTQNRLWNFG